MLHVCTQLLDPERPMNASCLPSGEKHGDEFVAINPLRSDTTIGSFKVNLTTGVWKDFAVYNVGGPDLVSLYMVLNDLDESAALDELESLLSESGLSKLPPKARKAIVPTKSQTRGDGCANGGTTSLQGHIVQIATIVGVREVDGGWRKIVDDCHGGKDCLDAPSSPQAVSGHTFCGRDHEIVRMGPERSAYCHRLNGIVCRC